MKNQHIPEILFKFAQLLGTRLDGHKLGIPEKFGSGYCAGYVFDTNIRLLISDYELKNDLIVEKPAEHINGKILFFKFQNIFPHKTAGATVIPSVMIATSRINTDEVFAIHSNTETINIEVGTAYLSSLFEQPAQSPLLQNLLYGTQPLFFEQMIHPALQSIVNEIVAEKPGDTFRLFFLRIKAEELICRLLMKLDSRQEKEFHPLADRDIRTVYQLRDRMLEQLDQPPVISDLAIQAGMSPTKLKRVFRQIFGDSIFNYFQQFRIKEAARLLKEEHLLVSEVGYRLGFTNLSHFSRVFEKHMGLKPKQYTRS